MNWRAMMILALILFVLTACGGGDDNAKDDTGENQGQNMPSAGDNADGSVAATPTSSRATLPPATTPTVTPTAEQMPSSTPRNTRTPFPTATRPGFDTASTAQDGGNDGNADANSPAAPSIPGRLLFQSARGGENFTFYLMPASGGDVTRLQTSASSDIQPDVSADGNQMVYVSLRLDNQEDVYFSAISGLDQIRVTVDAAQDLFPRFSPDGQQIAFMSDRDGDFDVYVYDRTSATLNNLTSDNSAFDGSPVWSPDGLYLAFTSGRDGGAQIYYISPSGENVRPTGLSGVVTDISPDGTRLLLYDIIDEDNSEIFMANIDGSNRSNISNHPAQDENARFSPDGLYIAYDSNRDENFEIYVVPISGGEAVNVTNNFADDRYPVWMPN